METNHLNNVSTLDTLQILRRQAELIISGQIAEQTANLNALSPAVVLKMVHELQVHQIELELQNEELRQTQLQLEAARARYFDLYDLAPISYCTVNETGIILEANLATSELLGEARNSLVGQRLTRYISKEFQDAYYLCRKLLLSTGERQSCELHMIRADGTTFWVKIAISSAKASNGDTAQRMVLTDISDAKVMALAMRESESRLRDIVDSHA